MRDEGLAVRVRVRVSRADLSRSCIARRLGDVRRRQHGDLVVVGDQQLAGGRELQKGRPLERAHRHLASVAVAQHTPLASDLSNRLAPCV